MGSGRFICYELFKLMQTLLSPATATASTCFTRLPSFFLLLFLLSLSFSPSFLSFLPSFNIFVRPLLEGAREGIINNYHQFYSIIIKIILLIFKIFNNRLLIIFSHLLLKNEQILFFDFLKNGF